MNENDIILSQLSRSYEKDGKSVDVEIYSSGEGNWILEVINDKGTSFVFEERFSSEEVAWQAFEIITDAKGIDQYSEN